MTPRKMETEERRLKAQNMQIKKQIENKKIYCQVLVENYAEGS